MSESTSGEESLHEELLEEDDRMEVMEDQESLNEDVMMEEEYDEELMKLHFPNQKVLFFNENIFLDAWYRYNLQKGQTMQEIMTSGELLDIYLEEFGDQLKENHVPKYIVYEKLIPLINRLKRNVVALVVFEGDEGDDSYQNENANTNVSEYSYGFYMCYDVMDNTFNHLITDYEGYGNSSSVPGDFKKIKVNSKTTVQAQVLVMVRKGANEGEIVRRSWIAVFHNMYECNWDKITVPDFNFL